VAKFSEVSPGTAETMTFITLTIGYTVLGLTKEPRSDETTLGGITSRLAAHCPALGYP
jgi:hypothetical protein